MFPALARYSQKSTVDTSRLAERGLRFMLVVALPLAWFTSLAARPLIEWFARGNTGADPGQFESSITVLRVVIWGLPFQAANHVLNRTLIAAGRERVFVTIGVAALVVNVVLNLVLIPRYGYYGAGVATVFTLAQSMVLHLYFVQRTKYRHPLRRALPGPLASLVVSWAATVVLLRLFAPDWSTGWFSLAVDAGWTPFLGGVALWGGLYVALVFALRVLGRDDLRLLPQLIGRR